MGSFVRAGQWEDFWEVLGGNWLQTLVGTESGPAASMGWSPFFPPLSIPYEMRSGIWTILVLFRLLLALGKFPQHSGILFGLFVWR